MFYSLGRGFVGFLTMEELKIDYERYNIPEQTIGECQRNLYNFRNNYFVSKDLIFVVLDFIQLYDALGNKGRVAIYVRQDLCLIVKVKDEGNVLKKGFGKVVERYEKMENGLRDTVPERFLYHFLDDLMFDDRSFLENMEMQMCELENRMLDNREDSRFIKSILFMKKELMYISNYYEQLLDIGEVLRDNENNLFPEENVKRFQIFTNRVNRIKENVKGLKEYAVQLQETYDAMMDYNLNQIMKLFTVVTTIFLPLTLIAGWYGMNFQYMPELNWRYGYPCVIVVSVLVVLGCLIWFRKRKLL